MLWAGCEGLGAEHKFPRAAEGLSARPQPELTNSPRPPPNQEPNPSAMNILANTQAGLFLPGNSPHGTNRAAALSQSLAAGAGTVN